MSLLATDFTGDMPITLEKGNRHENHSSETENSLEDQEKIENTLQNYQQSASESLAVNNNIYEIAYGSGFSTKTVLYENCEELAFQQYFRKSRFGYSVEREVKLTPSKYFIQKLLNDKQSLASNSDYIFLAQLVLLEKNFMKKKMGNIIAGKFENYKDSAEVLVNKDQGFYVINQIRGTPVYWKKFL